MPITRNNIHHHIYIFIKIDNYLISSGYKLLWVIENRNNITEFILLGLSQKNSLVFTVLTLLHCNSDQKPTCHDFYCLQSTCEAAHVFLSESPLPRRPLLHLHCDPQVDCWLAGSKEDHFLPQLHDIALHHALLWGDWGLHPHRDGLWPLCGHLQTSTLHSDHDQTEVRCHDRCLLRWGFPAFLRSVSPGHLFTLLWPMCILCWNWPALTPSELVSLSLPTRASWAWWLLWTCWYPTLWSCPLSGPTL